MDKSSIAFAAGRNSRDAQGKRKTARPFSPKLPLHVTFRSSIAREQIAKRWGIRVYRFVNVGNHVHLLVQARSRAAFQGFMRDFAGTVAIIITGAKKGNASGKFWDGLAWSRIVTLGREFKIVLDYFAKNAFEAIGWFGPREKAAGYAVYAIRDGTIREIG